MKPLKISIQPWTDSINGSHLIWFAMMMGVDHKIIKSTLEEVLKDRFSQDQDEVVQCTDNESRRIFEAFCANGPSTCDIELLYAADQARTILSNRAHINYVKSDCSKKARAESSKALADIVRKHIKIMLKYWEANNRAGYTLTYRGKESEEL